MDTEREEIANVWCMDGLNVREPESEGHWRAPKSAEEADPGTLSKGPFLGGRKANGSWQTVIRANSCLGGKNSNVDN